MPRATLSFKLPEEQDAFTDATQGKAMRLALCAINEYLRRQIKYNDHPPEIAAVYQSVRDMFFEEINANDISLE